MGKQANHSQEPELEKDLDAIRPHYLRLENDEPPALVDQAVLNLARREAEAQRAGRRRRMQWIGALSSMALLVVTLNLVIDQGGGPAPPAEPEAGLRMKSERDEANGITAESLGKQSSAELREESAPSPALRQSVPATSMAAEPAPAESDVLTDALEDKQSADFRSRPETWLLHITQLREDGLNQEAETELEAFRAAYPDYPLPENFP